jgi:hypothetical protein
MTQDFALSWPEDRFCKSYRAIDRKDGSFLHKRFHFSGNRGQKTEVREQKIED